MSPVKEVMNFKTSPDTTDFPFPVPDNAKFCAAAQKFNNINTNPIIPANIYVAIDDIWNLTLVIVPTGFLMKEDSSFPNSSIAIRNLMDFVEPSVVEHSQHQSLEPADFDS